jgi:hypothetical protein
VAAKSCDVGSVAVVNERSCLYKRGTRGDDVIIFPVFVPTPMTLRGSIALKNCWQSEHLAQTTNYVSCLYFRILSTWRTPPL